MLLTLANGHATTVDVDLMINYYISMCIDRINDDVGAVHSAVY